MELQEVEFRPRRRSERKSPDQVQQETSEQSANKDNVNQQPPNQSQEEHVIPRMQDDKEDLSDDEQSADFSHEPTRAARMVYAGSDTRAPIDGHMEACTDVSVERMISRQRDQPSGDISHEPTRAAPMVYAEIDTRAPIVEEVLDKAVACTDVSVERMISRQRDQQSADFLQDSTKAAPMDQEVSPYSETDGFDPSHFIVHHPMRCMDVNLEIVFAPEYHEPTYAVEREWPTPPSLNKKPEQFHEMPAPRGDSNPLSCFDRCWPFALRAQACPDIMILEQRDLEPEYPGRCWPLNSPESSDEQEGGIEFSPQDHLLPGNDNSGTNGTIEVSRAKGLPQGGVPKSELEKEEEDQLMKAAKKAEENDLDSALKSGDIKTINERVTPSILMKCTTNSLNKAIEVSHKLHALTRQRGPDEEDFLKLQKNVEEFAVSLLDPLKSDDRRRDLFGADIDSFVDMAIEKGQKKFLAHPVVYNILDEKWHGEFATFKNSPWTKIKWWTWLFLNLWTLFDVILFPVLFLVFFICHMITKVIRKKRGVKVGFVFYATGPEAETNIHPFMTETVKSIIETLGYKDGKFAVIARDHGKVKFMGFQQGYSKDDFLGNVISAPTQPPWMHLPLGKSLDKAKELFEKEDGQDEKVLVILTDYKATTKYDTKLDDADQTARKSGAGRVVAVAIGPFAKPQQLEALTDKDDIIISHGLENPKELGKNIAEKIQGRDVFEWYKLYFLTPYFIYLRDTVSFLALLILHYAVCLAPSTISLSGVEITIIIFFLGRVMMEIKQFVDAREAKTDSGKSNGHALWQKVGLYFRDRWNVLDFITILTFFVIAPLRLVTLSSFSITQNRTLAVANYMYGLNTMFLTLRVLGSILESTRRIGVMQIALFKIIRDVTIIFWQFLVAILAFSMAITKVFMAERSFIVSREKENEQLCKDVGLFCWWDTLRHLMWSLLGIADADKFGSTDKASINLVWALYAMFLVMAVIMLVNMLIAVLSNVYQGVEDNSLPEWCFKRAIMHRTYSNYHPIPAPLNIVTIPFMALYSSETLQARCCKRIAEENDDKETKERREKAINKLMLILEGEYFATYGYSFPLTDERKMDQVMEELAGNRKITNQIANRVFSSQNYSNVENWVGDGIRIDGNTLTYSAPDDCDKCQKEEPKPQHSVRYLQPLDSNCPVFEVLIQESGERRLLSVGVVLGSDRLSFHDIIPGWMEFSVGYHIDDGRIFYENHRAHGQELKDAMAHRGDIITCRVHFNEESYRESLSEVPVSFSLNGKEVGRKCVKSTGQLYPCIGMGYEGISVQFTMGRFNTGIMPNIKVDIALDEVNKTIEENQEKIIKEIRDKVEITHDALNGLQAQVNDINGVLRQIMAALAVNQPEGSPKRITNDNRVVK